jgi:twitching motility protein PilT
LRASFRRPWPASEPGAAVLDEGPLETYIRLWFPGDGRRLKAAGEGNLAQLDPLLNAMMSKNATELVLAEGQRAAFRLGGELRPVSQQVLDRRQIAALLSEISDEIDAASLTSGKSHQFTYLHPGGTQFVCEVAASNGSVRARLTPTRDGTGSPGPAVPAQVAPATAPAAVAPRPAARPGQGTEIDDLLIRTVREEASDLHLSSEEVPIFRLHGEMIRVAGTQPIPAGRMMQLLEPIFPEVNGEEFAEKSDTDFAYEIAGVARFRVNIFSDRKGTGAVFRVIPSEILTAQQLGLPKAVLGLCELSKGLVLVTGPTGSGKSTTLAAMVDHINRTRTDHIITIEDPVEFVHENQKCLVNQREIRTHTKGFKPALRAALREDPDIVLVGEMRDLETIAIAIETAETGHLVFGTLHTTTAISTVDRIIDQFPADRQAQIRTMLSESLKGVIAQTLVKKIGGGRAAALEVLIVTLAIANLIREAKTFQIASLMQTGRQHGMRLLNDALFELVKSGTVDANEAYRKAVDKSSLAAAYRKANIRFDPVADS